MPRKASVEADSKLIAVFEWQRCGAEEWRPVVRLYEPWVRLSERLPRQLGLGFDYSTLKRLMAAGFVQSRRCGPRCIEIHLPGLLAHLEATKTPGFWDRGSEAWRRWEAMTKAPRRRA